VRMLGDTFHVVKRVVDCQDCWSKVNPRKGTFPKLWNLLKEGGRGCAAATFHSLLPLLSQVPQEHRDNGIGFYELFFGSLQTGLV
jgi:hypothetical protein